MINRINKNIDLLETEKPLQYTFCYPKNKKNSNVIKKGCVHNYIFVGEELS
jgi:hypothetical protein